MENPDTLDFRALEKELAGAIAADQRYSRENEAKFRAIHQRVASYEEFRDIVLASNLKPLERKDKIGERKQPWNQSFVANSSSQKSECVTVQESFCEPTNAFEFTRKWRRLENERKYELLLQYGPKKLSEIFHAEVCSGLLGDILLVLEKNFQSLHLKEILLILQTLAKTKRFDLNIVFLSKTERESSQKLFTKLSTYAGATENEGSMIEKLTLENLMSCYKISDAKN
ncbi:hypothetical protein GDO86_014390 [Hymenochirus boettgeri]|uniref:Coiled-coil domain-containing protein 103 n=1 Tax=Hymenochirus boettgeri TaxID=247094 RepID=A0A8T2JNY9_9PIPI|nr:hypothetical protein GDO86_014390 [Hymenochirus boettgeri]